MNWQDVWKLPFQNAHGIYVKDADYNMVANFLFGNEVVQRDLINILNGVQESKAKHPVTYSDGKIFLGDRAILLIRGWGHLTGRGIGGLGLDAEVAAKIQDDFAQYIIERLSAKQSV